MHVPCSQPHEPQRSVQHTVPDKFIVGWQTVNVLQAVKWSCVTTRDQQDWLDIELCDFHVSVILFRVSRALCRLAKGKDAKTWLQMLSAWFVDLSRSDPP